jgi:HAD superfamily hydrolase (TIGR01509 family)
MPTQKMKIKSIIFDLGGVVVHSGYLAFLRHYIGSRFSKEMRKKILLLEHQVNLGKITENQFYGHLQKEFHVHITPKQMHEKIVESMKANKSLLSYIDSLKKSKVAMFSNTLGSVAQDTFKSQKIPVKKLFGKVFQSHILHVAKPTYKGYHFILENLKVKPHEALMVDDRRENIVGARKAGLNAIHFKNTDQFKKALKKYELV